ncbi:MAG: PhnD/SsuA/transferrin family substrate-binding protein [Chloroflexi bacterium]|nr:PhnD/SsuA/transferrin family substrate-binding protein [Chloroflexota bacterium]OJV89546.1 MAG: phosphonate ABC transporter substrate-binding protein [Chloroflexi bacterium 54-19]
MQSPILVGAVVYDPKVVVIWDIIKEFFISEGCPMDYVFYSNYELMVEALVTGHIHIAWNSPLAWLEAEHATHNECRAIAMRDTDRDRVTHIIVRRDSGISDLEDLKGKTVATGAKDSPQATLIPLQVLRRAGLEADKDFTLRRFDLLVGKHGDHVGGELEALRSLQRGESDACAVLDLNWTNWQADGTVDPAKLTVLATTPPFDHCNFTVREDFPKEDEQRWLEVLFRMTYSNPAHREMMDMEGLKEWLPGRVSGYAILDEAVKQQGFFEEAVQSA